VLDSVAAAADEAGVRVVGGDTKVVERGQADGMYAVTSGVGIVPEGRNPGHDRIGPGDVLLLSGTLAEHGLAVMLARQPETSIRSHQQSDVAPLDGLVEALFDAVPDVRFLRDPTRGGFAGVAADLAARAGLGLVIDEARIPLRVETRRIADMLGLDPLSVANEGKLMAVVAADDAEAALAALRAHPLGTRASLVGRFTESRDGLCEMITEVGGRRILQKPYGEELPRIC
jgi:hydrogenase expression/formation protein HypE